MKSFLTHAGAKVGRFFWSWGFLKFVVGLIVLIILFYMEEDWRGARAWAVTKEKWEARGETFDYKKFMPPSIPDDRNLAALPLFKMEIAPNPVGSSYLQPLALQKITLKSSFYNSSLIGNWQRGNLPDKKTLQAAIVSDYAATFKGVEPPQDILAQFDALYSPITALSGVKDRPLFLLKTNDIASPPIHRPLGVIVAGIKLSKVLTTHAVLALQEKRSSLALGDIETSYKVLKGIKQDPTLVAGLVSLGMAAVTDAAIYDGLAEHDWSDAQLMELEDTFASVDFLTGYQFAMRSEAAETVENIDYIKHLQGSKKAQLLGINLFWIDGWLDQNKYQFADFHLTQLSTVDPRSRRAFPKISLQFTKKNSLDSQRWDANFPWNIWFTIASKGETSLMQKYVEAQVWLDETRLACALERYHLAHGVYPASLDELAPACIDAVPHDILNGEPYRYRFRPDGTFLLYSVGWNQTDDGGVAIYTDPDHNGHPTQDYEHGDWVWPTPK